MPRTRAQTTHNAENVGASHNVKRHAIENPNEQAPTRKRAALGDLTNAAQRMVVDSAKKPQAAVSKAQVMRRSKAHAPIASIPSDEFIVSSSEPTSPSHACRQTRASRAASPMQVEEAESSFDAGNKHDLAMVPDYARDIFRYYRLRESKFAVDDYMSKTRELNVEMRAMLVDWMVEIQENFELNHETLYQAVKMADLYISKHLDLDKGNVQLVGGVALFIAAKFDERQPPLLDDFLYVCDDAYTREMFMEFERDVLVTLKFDIGMPLSYRFVRRFAKATHTNLTLLTLARYILELSLIHYEFALESDSRMAAAALALAMHMSEKRPIRSGNDAKKIWTPAHERYSEYTYDELCDLIVRLNTMLHTPVYHIASGEGEHALRTVHTKVFFSVAKQYEPLKD